MRTANLKEWIGLMRGRDLTKLHEYANTPRKYEGGSFYENPVTGRHEFIPKIGEGMVMPQDGRTFSHADSVYEYQRFARIALAEVRA